jgi:hypothetical protein
MLKFVERKQLCFSQALLFRKGCCSRKLQNSKTKKVKVNFLMDKSKTMKTKHKDVDQEETTVDRKYAAQLILRERLKKQK